MPLVLPLRFTAPQLALFAALCVVIVTLSCSAPRTDPIETFVRERMQPASAAFFVPSPMERGSPYEAVLEISPPEISPDLLAQELQAAASAVGVTASDSILTAPRMIATLVANRQTAIAPKDALDRAVKTGERVRWRWNVTPQVSGDLTLTVTLTAPVIVDGRETGYQITSFERTVTITVTPEQRADDILTWAVRNWVVLAAAGGLLLALATWLVKRTKRRRRAGF